MGPTILNAIGNTFLNIERSRVEDSPFPLVTIFYRYL